MAFILTAATGLGQNVCTATNLRMRHQGGFYFAFTITAKIENIDANLAQEDVKGHYLHPQLDPFI